MKELNTIVKNNVARIKRLGTFSSETLAKGYDEKTHGKEFEDLLFHLGQDFPIPVLEKLVKHYRAQLENCKTAIREQMMSSDIDSFVMEGNSFDVKDRKSVV